MQPILTYVAVSHRFSNELMLQHFSESLLVFDVLYKFSLQSLEKMIESVFGRWLMIDD